MTGALALCVASVAGLYGCSGVQATPNTTFVLLDGSRQSRSHELRPAQLCRQLQPDSPAALQGSVAKAWGDVQLTPTTYIVNKHGEIVKQYVGEPDFTALHALIEKLLPET